MMQQTCLSCYEGGKMRAKMGAGKNKKEKKKILSQISGPSHVHESWCGRDITKGY